jgi:hypothetical protein
LNLCLDEIDTAVIAATEEAHDHGMFSWFLELLELSGLPVAASTMPSAGSRRWLAGCR